MAADPFLIWFVPGGRVIVPLVDGLCSINGEDIPATTWGEGAWGQDGVFGIEVTLSTLFGTVRAVRTGTVDLDGRALVLDGVTHPLRETGP